MTEKRVLKTVRQVPPHWVGDGFPVRNLFSYRAETDLFDPFLLLDYAGPAEFAPALEPRGVGEHPHRGFETVTIVYQGEISHRDSGGNQGTIGPGDVQWMTAARGVVHEEFHSEAFTRRGGMLEMVQLWVNLPSQDKMTAPRYQEIVDRQIPRVTLGDGSATARVIAGTLEGHQGPAKTFTPVNAWDVEIAADRTVELTVPTGHTTLVVVQRGAIVVGGNQSLDAGELVVFDRDGDRLRLTSRGATRALVLTGQPIGEPVVGQGPFVMNSREQIHQAMLDYQAGRMGQLV